MIAWYYFRLDLVALQCRRGTRNPVMVKGMAKSYVVQYKSRQGTWLPGPYRDIVPNNYGITIIIVLDSLGTTCLNLSCA